MAAAGAVMLGGGVMVVFNTGSAHEGSDSPEDAFAAAMEAIESGDRVSFAEAMVPSERAMVLEAEFDFIEEIAPLDLEHLEVSVERPRSGLAHLYLGAKVARGAVHSAALRLGSLLFERLFDQASALALLKTELAEPTGRPLVAIERDGRWYLSLWYTVAENARIDAQLPLPDSGRRPASIGATDPEAAVRNVVDDALRLDMRRMIGGLDPQEAAALYDYSPLFLDEATTTANATLELLENDGDIAIVTIEGVDFSASSGAGSLDVTLGPDHFDLEYTHQDQYFGDEGRRAISWDGECYEVAYDYNDDSAMERSCVGNDVLPSGLVDLVPMMGAGHLSIRTREVDGRWYVSPIRTALVDFLTDFYKLGDFEIDDGFAFDWNFFAEGAAEASTVPAVPITANNDLLHGSLHPLFAYDLDSESLDRELELFVPELAGEAVQRVIDEAPNAEIVDGSSRVQSEDRFGKTVFLQARSNHLLIGARYGASVDELSLILDLQAG